MSSMPVYRGLSVLPSGKRWQRLLVLIFFLAASLMLTVFAVYAGLGLARDPTLKTVIGDGLLHAALYSTAAVCFLRVALVREERLAWAAMGTGIVLWASGSLYWALFVRALEEPPFPSFADALWPETPPSRPRG